MDRTLAGAALTIAVVALLTLPASAQEGATLPPGPIYLTDSLEVEAGETLTIGPGTSVTGPGNITVWGTLLVNGTAGSPAELGVQLRVLDGGRAELRQARLWGVNATALEITRGTAVLHDTLFEANTRAALVSADGRLEATDTVFRDHAGEALYVEGSAIVHLTRATFSGNGRGATLYSAREFHANDSVFVANGQHFVVDLGPWSAPGADILLARSRFDAPAPTPAQLPSIVVRYDATLPDPGDEQTLRMTSNRIAGAPVGMRIEGRGLVVESVNDTFVDNDVGVSVSESTVRLIRPTFGNIRNVDGSGRITTEDATVRGGSPPSDSADARLSWLPWALGVGVVLLVGAAVLVPRFLRPAPPPPPSPPAEPTREPRPVAPEPDLGTALSPTERRILEDILDHPGTAQRAVADRLGYTRQALHYHVKKLEARGLVRKTVEGRETRCEVPPAVASLLDATRTRTQEKA